MNALLRGLIVGAGRTYSVAVALKREAYRHELLRVQHVSAPVISVGALTAGGAGKTPVARFIAQQLLDHGLRVAVVCGGYRGSQRRSVSMLDQGRAWSAGAVERYGDEAVMLARSVGLRRAMVVCGRDRVAGARLAVQAGAQVVVLDDGFQHLRLHRDLELVLRGAGQIRDLADMRREGPGATARADLVWGHRRDGRATAGDEDVTSRCVARHLVASDGTVVGPAGDLRGQRVFLIAGIAHPQAFHALVRAAGADVVGQRWVGDHQPFRVSHLRAARRARAALILCTEKDLARDGARDLTALTVDLELLSGAGRLERALRDVAQRIRTC